MSVKREIRGNNLMDFDISCTATYEADLSIDSDQIDLENVLHAYRITKNYKTYLDLDTNMMEMLMNTETDKEPNAVIEIGSQIEPILDLDEFFENFDIRSEIDNTETGNADIFESNTIDDYETIKDSVSEHSNEDNIEKSKQEFEEILQCYYKSAEETHKDLNKSSFNKSNQIGNTCNFIEVPIEFQGNAFCGNANGLNTASVTSSKTKQNTYRNDVVKIIEDSDSEDSKFKKDNFIKIKWVDNCAKIDEKSVEPQPKKDNIKNLFVINKKIDTDVSILVIDSDSDSECEGYHSSDFEFITESEAKKAGLITHNPQKSKKYTKSSSDYTANNSTLEMSQKDYNIPGPSNIAEQGQSIENSKYWSKSYNRRLRIEQYYKDLKINRENHEIPQGDAYLNMFQGIQAFTSMFSENKTLSSAACMTIQDFDLDGIGMMGLNESVDRQLQEEAKENSKRILEKYPGLNRRKRRRY